MKLRFTDFAHDGYEDTETVERLVEEFGWDKATAERYAASHKPMGEVKGEFEYDADADAVRVISATIDGVKLVPERP